MVVLSVEFKLHFSPSQLCSVYKSANNFLNFQHFRFDLRSERQAECSGPHSSTLPVTKTLQSNLANNCSSFKRQNRIQLLLFQTPLLDFDGTYVFCLIEMDLSTLIKCFAEPGPHSIIGFTRSKAIFD